MTEKLTAVKKTQKHTQKETKPKPTGPSPPVCKNCSYERAYN